MCAGCDRRRTALTSAGHTLAGGEKGGSGWSGSVIESGTAAAITHSIQCMRGRLRLEVKGWSVWFLC